MILLKKTFIKIVKLQFWVYCIYVIEICVGLLMRILDFYETSKKCGFL